jgi:hypothetical protein
MAGLDLLVVALSWVEGWFEASRRPKLPQHSPPNTEKPALGEVASRRSALAKPAHWAQMIGPAR